MYHQFSATHLDVPGLHVEKKIDKNIRTNITPAKLVKLLTLQINRLLLCVSIDWFLYDRDFRHDRIRRPKFLFLRSWGASVNNNFKLILTVSSLIFVGNELKIYMVHFPVQAPCRQLCKVPMFDSRTTLQYCLIKIITRKLMDHFDYWRARRYWKKKQENKHFCKTCGGR